MGETQKNTGGMEQGTMWANEYIVFYSTGIHPKVREEQEQERLKKWDRQKRKSKKKSRKRAAPIAKLIPGSKRRENEKRATRKAV